jgi:hypothetical protein
MVKSNKGMGLFLYKIAVSARMVFIRAETAIRADGFLSAQLPKEMGRRIRTLTPHEVRQYSRE